MGIQENFLEEKTGSPPPFIFIIHTIATGAHLSKQSQFKLYTLIVETYSPGLGVSCMHGAFGFVLWS